MILAGHPGSASARSPEILFIREAFDQVGGCRTRCCLGSVSKPDRAGNHYRTEDQAVHPVHPDEEEEVLPP